MSRVIWGTVTKRKQNSDGLRQTTLCEESKTADNRKRSRAPDDTEACHQEDGILFGPSGGGNRETQNRRGRPFFNGQRRPQVFDRASPYSREHMAAVRTVRQVGGADAATTEFDEALLDPFLASLCPRNIFNGKVFFLNSCDADPQISVYLLEKLIRYLGGVTAMGVNGMTTYVVTQHLASNKEIRLANRKLAPSAHYIHPHFILACAREGRLVCETPFLTMAVSLGSTSTNVANATESGPESARKPQQSTRRQFIHVD